MRDNKHGMKNNDRLAGIKNLYRNMGGGANKSTGNISGFINTDLQVVDDLCTLVVRKNSN